MTGRAGTSVREPSSGYYCAFLIDYKSMMDRAIYAHRLWIRLWTRLGQQEENSGGPEGNGWVTGPWPPAVHSAAAAAAAARTAPVDTETGRDLAGTVMSPGSTVPMTTTSSYLSGRSNLKQAPGDLVLRTTRPRVACRPDPTAGGGVQ